MYFLGFGMIILRIVFGKIVLIFYGFFGCVSVILFFNFFLERIIIFFVYIFCVVYEWEMRRKFGGNGLCDLRD